MAMAFNREELRASTAIISAVALGILLYRGVSLAKIECIDVIVGVVQTVGYLTDSVV
jgi:hypothetical protein